MKNGRVKWYNEVKGYGFIEMENKEDVFVHRTGLHDSKTPLESDQIVNFELKNGDKGLFAVLVKPVN